MLESLGRYLLVRRIAVGGMGDVYLARQTGVAGFDRLCVVKLMNEEAASTDKAVELFLDEARVTARMTHAHIAQVYDFGKIDDVYFLAMEYVEGPSLQAVVRHFAVAGRKMPLELCARIMSQVAQGLDYAHRLNGPDGQPLYLVHRDVSPSNILVSREGIAKLIDFGIAKARMQSRRTRIGIVRGKLPYMSPEQMEGEPLDARSDVFALGLVLYELISGQRAVAGRNEMEVMVNARARRWGKLQQLRVDCPDALAAVVERAMARTAAERFATAAELSSALEGVIASQRWVVTPAALAALAQEVHAAEPPSGSGAARSDGVESEAVTDPQLTRPRASPKRPSPAPRASPVPPSPPPTEDPSQRRTILAPPVDAPLPPPSAAELARHAETVRMRPVPDADPMPTTDPVPAAVPSPLGTLSEQETVQADGVDAASQRSTAPAHAKPRPPVAVIAGLMAALAVIAALLAWQLYKRAHVPPSTPPALQP